MGKVKFSGHESFAVKGSWLRKGIAFVQEGHRFSESEAVVLLGVGKNMVASIRYWLRAFGLVDENDQLTEVATLIFTEKGWDPHIEHEGTAWLLQDLLVRTGYATVFDWAFNEYFSRRVEFSPEGLLQWLEAYAREQGESVNTSTLEKDVNMFVRTYQPFQAGTKVEPEDEFAKPLADLGLMERRSGATKGKASDSFLFERKARPTLPWQMVAYNLLALCREGNSISMVDALNLPNSAGVVFGLGRSGLLDKIREMEKIKYSGKPILVFSDTAGNEVIQFQNGLDQDWALQKYYHHDAR